MGGQLGLGAPDHKILKFFDTGAYDVQENMPKSFACDHHILDAVSLPEYSLMFTYSGGQM